MTTGAVVAQTDQLSLISTLDRPFDVVDHVLHLPSFRLLHFLFDIFALITAWHVTKYFRVWLNPVMATNTSASIMAHAAPPLSAILLLWVISSLLLRVYADQSYSTTRSTYLLIARSVAVMCGQAIAVIACSREFGVDTSRSFIPLFAVVSFCMLALSYCLSCFVACY